MLTIGHSNRSWLVFLELLQAHRVCHVVDVRTVPRSRHNPQFNRETLSVALGAEAIGYTHLPGLGGLRHPRQGSANTGWRNDSFRGYADYMQTQEFARNLEELRSLEARVQRDQGSNAATAIMCAEAVPWRCHRSLIADALVVRGVSVLHIMNAHTAEPHKLTSFARIEGTQITYPEPALDLF
jgi:uncharacterized protein (DUF488 family)